MINADNGVTRNHNDTKFAVQFNKDLLRREWLSDCQMMEGGKGVSRQCAKLSVGGYALFPVTRRDEIERFVNDKERLAAVQMAFKVTRSGAGLRVTRTA